MIHLRNGSGRGRICACLSGSVSSRLKRHWFRVMASFACGPCQIQQAAPDLFNAEGTTFRLTCGRSSIWTTSGSSFLRIESGTNIAQPEHRANRKQPVLSVTIRESAAAASGGSCSPLAGTHIRFHTSTPIKMTWEELIAKAEEHARAAGIPVEQLHKPKVRETALVSFISKGSSATAKFHLDATTGELMSAEYSGPEFTPKATGRQFSERAQRVLALASEESRRMGCEHVGSDHLLLGLLVNGEGSGAAVLSSAGLTAAAVRLRIAAIGSTAEVASSGYGPSMRNVLRLSSRHAETLGHPELEPEHFVLGLLEKADGPAMSLFRHFDVDIERAKMSLLQKMSDKSP